MGMARAFLDWRNYRFSWYRPFTFYFRIERKDFQKEPIKLKELLSVMHEPVLLKVSFLSIFAHGIIFTTMFGFTPTFALKLGLQTSDISIVIFSFMIPHAIATLFSGKIFVPYSDNGSY